ncbi:vWA domain-containing protein [Amycolatopsis sp.]|uniref:vWA domain-containing protein n=1 Tax=Amycolatopsis sp. TaxID=37632 RepID=UPI002C0775FC|nr:VWA domain-containing protein [Amycolatopsis sp.]HVV09362.1 VWA domain-containing protein [Amycolatopsis sp.]
MADLADFAARFCALLRAQGVSVGADRAARFADALVQVSPRRPEELYWCAVATLAAAPGDVDLLGQVFEEVFGDAVHAAFRDERTAPGAGAPSISPGAGTGQVREVPTAGSALEVLASRDFGELEPGELALLREMMRRFRFAPPVRKSRRRRPASGGRRVDMRETLRGARRSGGEAVTLHRWAPREKPRKLVVLCDISGSMQAYARAMLQLLMCAHGGARAEVFTFATRLTRLSKTLAADSVAAMRRAGEVVPDWSGGTRIGAALREFLDSHGARGMARGAVVVIISDGWETGEPGELGAQMARLSRLAHRIVWANPRTARPGYRPLAGGMAAAWPYCDAVVSAHRLDAIGELLAAIGGEDSPTPDPGARAGVPGASRW